MTSPFVTHFCELTKDNGSLSLHWFAAVTVSRHKHNMMHVAIHVIAACVLLNRSLIIGVSYDSPKSLVCFFSCIQSLNGSFSVNSDRLDAHS